MSSKTDEQPGGAGNRRGGVGGVGRQPGREHPDVAEQLLGHVIGEGGEQCQPGAVVDRAAPLRQSGGSIDRPMGQSTQPRLAHHGDGTVEQMGLPGDGALGSCSVHGSETVTIGFDPSPGCTRNTRPAPVRHAHAHWNTGRTTTATTLNRPPEGHST